MLMLRLCYIHSAPSKGWARLIFTTVTRSLLCKMGLGVWWFITALQMKHTRSMSSVTPDRNGGRHEWKGGLGVLAEVRVTCRRHPLLHLHPFQMALVKNKKSWQKHSFILQMIRDIIPQLILLSFHPSAVKTLQQTFAMFHQQLIFTYLEETQCGIWLHLYFSKISFCLCLLKEKK